MVHVKDLKNTQGDIIYPRTKTKAITNDAGVNLDELLANAGQNVSGLVDIEILEPIVENQVFVNPGVDTSDGNQDKTVISEYTLPNPITLNDDDITYYYAILEVTIEYPDTPEENWSYNQEGISYLMTSSNSLLLPLQVRWFGKDSVVENVREYDPNIVILTPDKITVSFKAINGNSTLSIYKMRIAWKDRISQLVSNLVMKKCSFSTQSYVFGNYNRAFGDRDFIFGDSNEIRSNGVYCFGDTNRSDISSSNSLIVGANNKLLDNTSYSLVSGYNNTLELFGSESLCVGNTNTVWEQCSGCVGLYLKNKGASSFAVGSVNTIEFNGDGAFICGEHNTANGIGQIVGGKMCKTPSPSSGLANIDGDIFVLGNGVVSGEAVNSNAFRVDAWGEVYAGSQFHSGGADYAEYFEWLDGNLSNEDRIGYFVTIKGNKIQIANSNDYILGIISGFPCIVGNSDEDWQGKFLHDKFNRFIKEEVESPVQKYQHKLDKNGKQTGEIEIVETGEVTNGKRHKLNPNYDPTQPYIERKDRPEWSAVGMLGVLSVRDDGTCQVDGFCKPADGGIATHADNYIPGRTYRVIERVTDDVIKVVFK